MNNSGVPLRGPNRTRAAVALLLISVLGSIFSCSSPGDEKRSLPKIGSVDFRALSDGEYEAYYNYYDMCDARVRVSVRDGRITDIELLRHFHFPALSGAKVIGRIIEEQSLNVDTVSGATGSSLAILKAVETAITGADAQR